MDPNDRDHLLCHTSHSFEHLHQRARHYAAERACYRSENPSWNEIVASFDASPRMWKHVTFRGYTGRCCWSSSRLPVRLDTASSLCFRLCNSSQYADLPLIPDNRWLRNCPPPSICDWHHLAIIRPAETKFCVCCDRLRTVDRCCVRISHRRRYDQRVRSSSWSLALWL